MLIPEDLLLLLLDDESGRLRHGTYLDTAVGGALLAELALAQHVEVVKGSGVWARAKVVPTGSGEPEDDVRRQLGDAVVRGATPTERTAALVALLSAMGVAHQVIDREGLSGGEVRKRAKAIAEGDWAAKAVKDAIAAVQAAIAATMVASTSVAASGGS